MDIFNGRYFIFNKKLLSGAGVWPYESYQKKVLSRTCFTILMFSIIIPQVIRIYLFIGVDLDVLIQHVTVVMYMLAIYLKLVTSFVSEEKLKVVYENIAQNWISITDKKEESILTEFSERGRLLTIGYILYMFSALVVFTMLPLTPMVLDVLIPLNESRTRIFILGGEYLFMDRDQNYGTIFMLDFACCILSALLISAIDSTYAACIEHCLGLFAIIKFRLQMSTRLNIEKSDKTKFRHNDPSYDFIVQTIQMHSKIMKFTDILESSYSFSFLLLMGLNIVLLSMEIILVLIKIDQPLEFIRYIFILVGILIHLFYVSWPGQKVIDYSSTIFQDAYLNEWYNIPTKAQKLLGFMSLRSIKPCQLTAGGIYVMNFSNFAVIIKTSLSYMTLLASFR